MAGDWIKMRVGLDDNPKVVSIAMDCDVHELMVVGALHKLWSWADKYISDNEETNAVLTQGALVNPEDGNAVCVRPAFIDRYVSVPGMCAAMESVGWLTQTEAGIVFNRFLAHNGNTARKRAQTAKRVAKSEAKARAKLTQKPESTNAPSVRTALVDEEKTNAPSVRNALAREEKRREEKKEENNTGQNRSDCAGERGLSSLDETFEEFRKEYPGRKRGHAEELKSMKKHRDHRDVIPLLADTLAAQKAHRASLTAAGEFVPPWPDLSTWINQRRWTEELPTTNPEAVVPAEQLVIHPSQRRFMDPEVLAEYDARQSRAQA